MAKKNVSDIRFIYEEFENINAGGRIEKSLLLRLASIFHLLRQKFLPSSCKASPSIYIYHGGPKMHLSPLLRSKVYHRASRCIYMYITFGKSPNITGAYKL